ncbi:ComEA family DNA-binding protein [Eubacterium sp. BX4]|uniref:ComEA family DNA-binding protein n=1 Tax=Eubacterium segne TaxID=2763045 RepID=A0ABR7F3L1_9FIRM|nr:ComEA family DNA-binding protein [Eubacterium segne]MBC5668204.1 ComEA family DNA-binding protein [Eubacterium segne]
MFNKLNKKYTALVVIGILTLFFLVVFSGCENNKNSVSLESENETKTRQEIATEAKDLYVYVTGAVKKPGVYAVKQGSRVFEVIEKAGGMIKAAKKDYINQAETVADSQNINIITKKQYKKLISNEKNQNNDNKTGSGKININSADVAELTGLSGIGEAKAKAIIQYRNENGNFTNIEDIKKVSGIGDALFKKISNEITAN